MSTYSFHPAVQAWFDKAFSTATEVQEQAWAALNRQNQHILMAAPTGSGKTLAAFLSAIDSLVKEGLDRGLSDTTRILYISPLKALSNDIQRNLQQPLQGIREQLELQGFPDVDIRAWVRTGDTPQSERQKAKRQPPHILVTTPESAYILLTSESGRQMLGTVETVIVDEIHALAGNKRGSHLTLSLERLQTLAAKPLQRVGLSATQKPIENMARFLIGNRNETREIIDTGHTRDRDLEMEIPLSPLQAVMSNEVWEEIYDRLESLILSHRTTLVFVNTRRLAERASRFLAQRIGEEHIMAHHGSMAKEKRLEAEQRLKDGLLKCLVATSSLELGIDIGEVDLVCQLGSPRAIAVFLQRVGRSGHAVGATPKGRLFPLTRDELVESTALLNAARSSELDSVLVPEKPLDILAQQIVAEVASREWAVQDLFASFRQAWPYRKLEKKEFDAVVQMLSQGFSTRRGRRSAHIHYDAVNGRLRPRQGTRLTALTNGGAIPDQFDYDVILTPEGLRVGTLNEDFAFESIPGDIFQLGNTSYRMLKIEQGRVFVEDAKGEPPNIPFWFGEAPARTDELSRAVSELRTQVNDRLDDGLESTVDWLAGCYRITSAAAGQLAAYLASAKAALGQIPTQEEVVFERFLDEVGDMHLIIHSCYGSRVNRAWGLALRKRFCRKFNFELQAAALEDSIILSLSATHSFPIEEVTRYLNPTSVRDVLTQALLTVPMFAARWRWNATIALAVKRNNGGKRTPPYFQRADAEDLIAVIFPDQLACQENITGNREIPDHPLVNQTIDDCLEDTMDIEGLIELLSRLEQGEISVICKDLAGPSPLSQEIINARPYAFLDDAPAEERRALAIRSRNYADPADAAELGKLDPSAIEKVRQEAWPVARNEDELHDALVLLGFSFEQEAESTKHLQPLNGEWRRLFEELKKEGRAIQLMTPTNRCLWVAVERMAEFQMLFPNAPVQPELNPAISAETIHSREEALKEIIRSRLECLGPVTASQLAGSLGLAEQEVNASLLELEQEGFVVRGRFTGGHVDGQEWCERHLLARIHRYTIKQLRSEIEPVGLADFMRYLFQWQGLTDKREGTEALALVLEQLEGFAVAAAAWESEVIPARVARYTSDALDVLCSSGAVSWMRLSVPAAQGGHKTSSVKNSPVVLVDRQNIGLWRNLAPLSDLSADSLSGNANKVYETMRRQGASFFIDLVQQTGLLRTQVEEALGELANWGLISSDYFAGLRALTTPQNKRPRFAPRRGRRPLSSPFDRAGRWSLLQHTEKMDSENLETEFLAEIFLLRYGVVFRKLLEREAVVPPWRDLLRVYWRMEARGEIRGGRFVDGMAGEQFARPDAIEALRSVRRRKGESELIAVSASDPLNLVGILLPGEKIAAKPNHRVLFRDGVPAAVQSGKDIRFLEEMDENTAWQARLLLTKKQNPAGFKSSAPNWKI